MRYIFKNQLITIIQFPHYFCLSTSEYICFGLRFVNIFVKPYCIVFCSLNMISGGFPVFNSIFLQFTCLFSYVKCYLTWRGKFMGFEYLVSLDYLSSLNLLYHFPHSILYRSSQHVSCFQYLRFFLSRAKHSPKISQVEEVLHQTNLNADILLITMTHYFISNL